MWGIKEWPPITSRMSMIIKTNLMLSNEFIFMTYCRIKIAEICSYFSSKKNEKNHIFIFLILVIYTKWDMSKCDFLLLTFSDPWSTQLIQLIVIPQDVMILVYSPWCGFCASVAHIYLSLARYFKAAKHIIFSR